MILRHHCIAPRPANAGAWRAARGAVISASPLIFAASICRLSIIAAAMT